jgi:hypothetical protein
LEGGAICTSCMCPWGLLIACSDDSSHAFLRFICFHLQCSYSIVVSMRILGPLLLMRYDCI